MFQIEKGIAIPARQGSHYGSFNSFLKSLEVGDSFVVPPGPHGYRSDTKYRTVYQKASKLGIRVTTRVQKDGSVRIWRTA
jgi:hypothetical protein